MRELVLKALCLAGVPGRHRRRNQRRLPVLMYHGVVERRLEPFCWHQIPLASFERQMRWLASRYRVLPLSEALAHLEAGTLPPRCCAVTFDDGYQNVLTNALPVLAAARVPATVFLVTDPMGTDGILWPDRCWLAFARTEASSVHAPPLGLVKRRLSTPADRGRAYADAVRVLKGMPVAEKDAHLDALCVSLGLAAGAGPGPFRMLTWPEAKALTESGLVELAGHGVNHEILSRLPDGAVAGAIGPSHAAIARHTGRTPVAFAYPNGRPMDFDDRARAALDAVGVRFAFTTVEGLVDPGCDRLALPRIAVGSGDSFDRFRLSISGAMGAFRRARAH
jgi:peptidoglycan/xylan/chitin deacetylase (PgdA/CDA1 family)